MQSQIHTMTATQSDLAYAIWVHWQYNHDPSNEHIVALLCGFQYVTRIKNRWLGSGGASGGALGEWALTGGRVCALGWYFHMDCAGCLDNNKSKSGLVITFERAVDCRSRKQKSNALYKTAVEYYAFGGGCMRLTQITRHFNKLSIHIIFHVFSDSQLLIVTIKNRIYRGTPITHIGTKKYLATDMARDEEIDLSYIPTAEMLADCFTQPVPKPPFMKQFTAMVMVGIEYRNGRGNGRGNWNH